ncbi:MAG TPA: DnaJ family domain-containing protein [Methylophilaceae bacterium]|nr:DnaJ family domain-containing protein [Methylophilaceae bacterium]
MQAFETIAEQRIQEALARGELDNLPGAGRPLDFDDDRLVPQELRMVFRILKNSGYVPPEVQNLKDIAELEREVLASSGEKRSQAIKKLRLLAMRVNTSRSGNLRLEADYYDRLAGRLAAE